MEDKEDPEKHLLRGKGGFIRFRKYGAPLISVLALCAILAIIIIQYAPKRGAYQVGRPSPHTVLSKKAFTMEDEAKTEELREIARQGVYKWFINPAYVDKSRRNVSEFFRTLEEKIAGGEEVKKLERWAREGYGLFFSDSELEKYTNLDAAQRESLARDTMEIVDSIMSTLITPERIEEKKIESLVRAQELPLEESYQIFVGRVASSNIKNNTDASQSLVELEAERAASQVEPIYLNVDEGEIIVRKGDLLTETHIAEMKKAGAFSAVDFIYQAIGIVLFLVSLSGSFFYYLKKRKKPRLLGSRMIYFYITSLFILTFLTYIFSLLAESNLAWGFMVPLPFLSMLFVLMVDRETSLVMLVIGAAIVGLIFKGTFYVTLAALLNGLVAFFFSLRASRREELMREGLWISGALALTSFSIALIFTNALTAILALCAGVGNGILSSVLTMGLFTAMENISGITTNIKLLEISSPEHPLMHKLIAKASGTYAHSLIVGNLAEAAAKEVGADPLLARVGAYYHDIGKIKRPSFFAENMPEGRKEHENINPNLSALIIAAHVKEGVELAREYHLPQEVTDIIRQHHGNSVIKYFYARAIELMGKEDKVAESRFRYPGEKPRSKEAGIVLLADAVEAATRVIPKGSPVKIEQVIQNVIEERLRDGQLDECDLSISDLNKVNHAFLQIIAGAYHERVEYPAIVLSGQKWKY